MGYSMTQEKHERLLRYEREGRRCTMNTGRGGCATRATWTVTTRVRETGKVETLPFCKRHADEAVVTNEHFGEPVVGHDLVSVQKIQ